jgi:hypothetical protein
MDSIAQLRITPVELRLRAGVRRQHDPTMHPGMKRLAIVAGAMFAAAVLFLAVLIKSSFRCAYDEQVVTPAPGGDRVAVTYRGNCSALDPYAYNVAVSRPGAPVRHRGNVLVALAPNPKAVEVLPAPPIAVAWTGPRALTVTYDVRYTVFVHAEEVEGVRVTYRRLGWAAGPGKMLPDVAMQPTERTPSR